MITLIAFLLAIGVLVTFHELGHYVVAKLCGVKVLRFSIGFGRPLASWRMFDTEWVVSPIPLGGYVKMLDERETPVPQHLMHQSFNAKPVPQRMAIIAAGPLANLLLAVMVYWVVIAHGVVQLKPWVGTVVNDSPAAVAGFVPGDRIVSIAGQPVASWHDARLTLADTLSGSTAPLEIVVQQQGHEQLRRLDVPRFEKEYGKAFQVGEIGLMPVKYLTAIGSLEPNGAAVQAGLKPGDQLLAVDGKVLPDWQSWVTVIRNSPGKALNITIRRQGQTMSRVLRPGLLPGGDGLNGYVGISPEENIQWVNSLKYIQHVSVAQALNQAFFRTVDTSWMSLKFLGRMVIGKTSLDNLSGPLTIATIAGKTAREGVTAYLEFIALISISIGILNLLPIPILDGGHLLYYTAELIRGKPLSERAQLLGQRVGFAMLFVLMAFAMLNDISRLWGG